MPVTVAVISLTEQDVKDLEVLVDMVLANYVPTCYGIAEDLLSDGEVEMADNQIKIVKSLVRACYKLGYKADLKPHRSDVNGFSAKLGLNL